MSLDLLQKLEHKIDFAIETIELLRMQIDELEEKNKGLREKNANLQAKQTSFEKNLNLMLDKLEHVDNREKAATTTEMQEEPVMD